jgi:hypothetical protein
VLFCVISIYDCIALRKIRSGNDRLSVALAAQLKAQILFGSVVHAIRQDLHAAMEKSLGLTAFYFPKSSERSELK